MSWFEYGTPKKRSLRKGVWLRVQSLPDDILTKAKSLMKPGELIQWVVVKEIRPKDQVYLEFWCKEDSEIGSRVKFLKRLNAIRKNPLLRSRSVVFGFLTTENPNWICEGDLGKGYRE